MRFLTVVLLTLGILSAGCRRDGATSANPAAAPTTPPASVSEPAAKAILWADARPILDAHRATLPPELKNRQPADLEAAWPGWVARHNAEIRARLARGDEDSLVNFWLFGTSFTKHSRATPDEIERLGNARAEELLLVRLDDLVEGIASPGTNERLQFAREVIGRHGIDPTTPLGKDQASVYLVQARERMIADNARYRRAAESAKGSGDETAQLTTYSTLYQDRGLSSDTSIRADSALERSLEAMKAAARIPEGGIRRVAVIGPGLDFTDKAEGYDFYAQQTIQPFALIDSLIRLGFSKPDDLGLATLDLRPRVNRHLEAARARAQRGDAYVLQLPLKSDDARYQSHPDLVSYWQRVGDRIGENTTPAALPSGVAGIKVRAVRVRPAVVRSVVPYDVNIVLERLVLADAERFDLIVATNILVYYDTFEQALALANVASMLKPGGVFLTNYAVTPGAPMESKPSLVTKVYWDLQKNGDTLFWYQRQNR